MATETHERPLDAKPGTEIHTLLTQPQRHET